MPDDLKELFWDEWVLGWWITMIYGVRYSLIRFWMQEEGIPLMRRNLSDELLQQIDRRGTGGGGPTRRSRVGFLEE